MFYSRQFSFLSFNWFRYDTFYAVRSWHERLVFLFGGGGGGGACFGKFLIEVARLYAMLLPLLLLMLLLLMLVLLLLRLLLLMLVLLLPLRLILFNLSMISTFALT